MDKKSTISVFGAAAGLILIVGPVAAALWKGGKRQGPKRGDGATTHTRHESDSAPPVSRAELHIPQAVVDQYLADQRRDSRRDWIRLAVETLGLIALIGGGIAAICNVRILTQQADISAQQLDLTDRPPGQVDRTVMDRSRLRSAR